jgi:hypothetical protein
MYIKRIPCKLGISTFALQSILMIAKRTLSHNQVRRCRTLCYHAAHPSVMGVLNRTAHTLLWVCSTELRIRLKSCVYFRVSHLVLTSGLRCTRTSRPPRPAHPKFDFRARRPQQQFCHVRRWCSVSRPGESARTGSVWATAGTDCSLLEHDPASIAHVGCVPEHFLSPDFHEHVSRLQRTFGAPARAHRVHIQAPVGM